MGNVEFFGPNRIVAGWCSLVGRGCATGERYETDASLRNVLFDEAEHALKTVVGLLEKQGIFPLEFPTT